MPRLSALLVLLLAAAAPLRAFDYLALGAASAVSPLGATPARLLRHRLELSAINNPPCYEIGGAGSAQGLAQGVEPVGRETPCRPDTKEILIHPLWRVKDTYTLSADADVPRVELLLPVRTWAPDAHASFVVPGIAGLRVSAGGRELSDVQLSWIRPQDAELPNELRSARGTLGYLWKVSLSSGVLLNVEVSYDIEVEYFDAPAEDYTYAKDAPPWYMSRLPKGATWQELMRGLGPVRRVRYFLKPEKLWPSPRPSGVDVSIQLPPDLPESQVQLLGQPPLCLGRRFLEMKIDPDENAELAFAYPKDPQRIGPLATLEEWAAWLGPDIKLWPQLTCDLTRRMRQDGDEKLQLLLQSVRCAVQCPAP